jgi:hypothetical protein
MSGFSLMVAVMGKYVFVTSDELDAFVILTNHGLNLQRGLLFLKVL